MDCTTTPRPRLAVTRLEDRVVPAGELYISDVLFDVGLGSGNQDTRQYFELRGDPGGTVPGKTYMVVVSGEPGTGGRPGTINAVFDLGGAPLGSDGYLSVVQANNPYTFAPGTAVLRGTTTGFGGLGGTNPDRFSDNSTLSNRFEFIFGTNTFLLVRANTAPVPNADVDNNNDGLLDGAASTWTVLDSVGVIGTFVGANATQIGYGRVNFSEVGVGNPPLGIVPNGSTLIPAESYGHVARVGESTGYTKSDWVAGLPRVQTAGQPLRYDASIFGHPTQRRFVGLPVDVLGASNFVAPISGRVFTDGNGNGTPDPGEAGVAGQTVWVDRNGNGILDSYSVSVDADGFALNTELTNLFDRVTLSTANTNPVFDANNVTSQQPSNNVQPTTGTEIFGNGGFNFWTTGGGLRADFYKPVSSVSIDFIATTVFATFAQVGRLEAYDANGALLQTVFTSPLAVPQSETMTITRAAADIAYVIAVPDQNEFPYFDNLRFTLPEESAVTDATGAYKITDLEDGTYTVRTIGGAQLPATITTLRPVRDVNFGTGGGIGGGGGGGGGGGVLGLGRTLAVGGGPGAVTVYGAVSGQLTQSSIINFPVLFPDNPFDGTYRTATGDVNGDGTDDVVVATGPGTPVKFAVIDGRTGSSLLVPLTSPFAGSESFAGGAFVSVGDMDADGRAEIVLTPDQGGGPRVTIVSVLPVGARVKANFLGINDPNFRGGARTAVGDLNGDGRADLVVTAGFQGGPRVALYDGRQASAGTLIRLTADFFAFDPNLRNGVYAAIGDVNGDGAGDLTIGAGPGGGPAVLILNGRTLLSAGPTPALAAPLARFLVNNDDTTRGGVRVAMKNVDGDNRSDLVTGSGENQDSFMRVYAGRTLTSRGDGAAIQDVDPFGVFLTDGVFVG
jgi:hypothetical protein